MRWFWRLLAHIVYGVAVVASKIHHSVADISESVSRSNIDIWARWGGRTARLYEWLYKRSQGKDK